jgi:Zn-dependent protease with chaperone function
MTATRFSKAATLVAGAAWAISVVLLWRTKVPDLSMPSADPADFFPAVQRHRAEHYSEVARLLYVSDVAVQLAVLVVLALLARRLARGFDLGEIGTGVMIAVAANLFVWTTALPLAAVGHWWARRYGLSKRSYGSFVGEQAITLLVQTATVAIVLAVIMVIARRLRRRWWLVVAPLFVGVGAGFVVALSLLAPLGAQRIRDPQVAAAVRTLSEREGVPGTKVRVEKVSDTTRAVNAETIGFGPTTVVILWDTLFRSRLSDRAIEFVAAHELGHAARRHIWKGLAWGLVFSLPLTFLLAEATRRRGGLHRGEVVPYALLVSAVLGLATTPLQNVVSRRYEAEADWMALQATGDPAAAREAFRSFTRIDLTAPNPPLWSYVVLDDHPTVMQRLAMANAWEATRRAVRRARPSRAGS